MSLCLERLRLSSQLSLSLSPLLCAFVRFVSCRPLEFHHILLPNLRLNSKIESINSENRARRETIHGCVVSSVWQAIACRLQRRPMPVKARKSVSVCVRV